MSQDHPSIKLEAALSEPFIEDEYPFKYSDRLTELSVDYDGFSFQIDSRHKLDDENKWQCDEIRTFGWKHTNLLICSLLALLEAYGQPSLLNDPDIQEDYAEMVQKTKDAYAEEAFKQILDGLNGG